MSKKAGEKFTDNDYKRHVRNLGNDHLASFPRRIAK